MKYIIEYDNLEEYVFYSAPLAEGDETYLEKVCQTLKPMRGVE